MAGAVWGSLAAHGESRIGSAGGTHVLCCVLLPVAQCWKVQTGSFSREAGRTLPGNDENEAAGATINPSSPNEVDRDEGSVLILRDTKQV